MCVISGEKRVRASEIAESRYACRMCGRFVQSITWRELHELLAGLAGAPVELKPRYNLAPGQDAAIIRAAAEGPGSIC